MRSIIVSFAVAAFTLALPTLASAQVLVVGGATSVALDFDALRDNASLDTPSVSAGIGSGVLPGSFAFPINSRTAASLPTTFEYTAGNFPSGPFAGTIEHTGSVFFNNETVEVGNFTIGFDAGRADAVNSGFFVSSTTGIAAPLFDIAVTEIGPQTASALEVEGDLRVTPTFAQFLLDNSLATADLTGVDVGDARIVATAIPEPTAIAFALSAATFAVTRRRR
ncbi:MAG: hypothetical protein AAF805_02010 [Planctomycetota bacterium]